MVSRRDILGTIGLAAGAGLAAVYAGEQKSEPAASNQAPPSWRYVPLVPAEVAAEAYRTVPDGGCMYGLFKAVLTAWSKQTGCPLDFFPFHMFRYGAGGIAGWGSICGALNGGAAIIGLFETDKTRSGKLIGELFSWYEQTELPSYEPSGESSSIAQSAAASVLCHISVAHWCTASGVAPLSAAMNERCRRLTADVAAKTVELLNRVQTDPPTQAAVSQASPGKPPQSLGKMNCATCHPTSKGQP